MENQVEEVKQKTDIVSIIGERIELKKAGRNYKANCPFHSEKTPSFMVSPELQIFKCFGCQAGGDAFSFLEKYEGMDFREALKYLADRVGIKLKSFKLGDASEKEKLIEIHSQALRFYNYILLNHETGKKALLYLLNERGLKRVVIEEFQLGYSPQDSTLINKFLIDKKKFTPSEVERAGVGLVRGSNIYDRFSGRVIFPLFDHKGTPVGFSGRVLPWDKRETGKYINSPETLIYHKSSVLYGLNLAKPFIKKKGVAIIVEGELDAISSYQAGIRNIVAIKGSALTEDQVRLLSRFAQKFLLALDTDLAGDLAARRGIAIATNVGIEVKVAKLEKYKDPDEATRLDLSGYKKSLINSVGVWDYLIDSIFSRFDATTGSGKAKISKELAPILGEIGDKIVQAHYLEQAARRLGIPVEAVGEEVEKKIKSPADNQLSETKKLEERGRKQLLEERFLSLAFQSGPKVLLEDEVVDLVTIPLNKRIFEEYRLYASENKVFDPGKFAEGLPGELFNGFAQMVLTDSVDILENPDRIQKELDLVKKELKIASIRRNLEDLTLQIRELEEKSEKKKLSLAQQKFNELASILSKLTNQDETSIIFSE